jgi:prevent-host-death family protein
LASEYELGAVAQLGERCHGMAEVTGSSPVSSTGDVSQDASVGAHVLRQRFGWYMERAAAGEEIHVTKRGRPYVRLVPFQEALKTRPRRVPVGPDMLAR